MDRMGSADPIGKHGERGKGWKVYGGSVVLAVGSGMLFEWIVWGGNSHMKNMILPPFFQTLGEFSLVWAILYLLMGIGAARIYLKPDSEMRIYALKTFIWQILFNWMWGVWLFRFQWYAFSLLWLLMLIVQVAWTMAAFRALDLPAACIQIPYFLWLIIASYLNAGVLVLNG